MQYSKKEKDNLYGVERYKLLLFTDDLIVYLENIKEPAKFLLELIDEYSNVKGQCIKLYCFLFTSNKQLEFEINSIKIFLLKYY